MAKKIPLQNGMYAIVDDEDFERCNQYNWYLHDKGNWEEVRTTIDGEKHLLKRYILGYKGKFSVVHKNRDRLDFTKENLLIVPPQDRINMRKSVKNSSSKYKGVSWLKREKKWQAQISHKGKNISLGQFRSEDEAARTYNRKALELFGEHAYQNVIGVDNRTVEIESIEEIFRPRKNKKKKFIGVSLYKPNNKWRSRINFNKKTIYIGYYDDEVSAAKAYDKKAYELYGNKAILNFPELTEEYKKEIGTNQHQKCTK